MRLFYDVIIIFQLSTLQYFSDPLHCYHNKAPSATEEKYADLLCWMSNTYKLPEMQGDFIKREDQINNDINYYQWVPLCIVAQAIFFYLPYLIWRTLYTWCGVDFKSLASVSANLLEFTKSQDEAERQRNNAVDYIEGRLPEYLRTSRRRTCFHGRCLSLSYLATKMIYLINSILQLVFISCFLGTEFFGLGFRFLDSLRSDEVVSGMAHVAKRSVLEQVFPYVTLCSYEKYEFGDNVHRTTVQCVLPINFYNEKVYLLIWLWLMILLVANVLDLIRYFVVIFIPKLHQRFLKGIIGKGAIDELDGREVVKKWASELECDGVFLLRVLNSNVPHHVMVTVTSGLFKKYADNRNNNNDDTIVRTDHEGTAMIRMNGFRHGTDA